MSVEERLGMLEEQMKVMDLRQSIERGRGKPLYEKRCKYLMKLFGEIGLQYQDNDGYPLTLDLPGADTNNAIITYQKDVKGPVFPMYRLLETVFEQEQQIYEQGQQIYEQGQQIAKLKKKLEDKPNKDSLLGRLKKKVIGNQSSSFQNKTVW